MVTWTNTNVMKVNQSTNQAEECLVTWTNLNVISVNQSVNQPKECLVKWVGVDFDFDFESFSVCVEVSTTNGFMVFKRNFKIQFFLSTSHVKRVPSVFWREVFLFLSILQLWHAHCTHANYVKVRWFPPPPLFVLTRKTNKRTLTV